MNDFFLCILFSIPSSLCGNFPVMITPGLDTPLVKMSDLLLGEDEVGDQVLRHFIFPLAVDAVKKAKSKRITLL